MIRYFTSREIATRLEVNLARWKRWSRAFLPPDPLGGLQSGVARQYLFRDLFTVALGGWLLSVPKLSVAESQQVLDDLTPWLKKNGYLRGTGNGNGGPAVCLPWGDCLIYFWPKERPTSTRAAQFAYQIHQDVTVHDSPDSGGRQSTITCQKSCLKADSACDGRLPNSPDVRLIHLTAIYRQVLDRLELV